jgi:hypothetical protein
MRTLHMILTICAAGYGVSVDGIPPLMVCGRAPGHAGPHHDIAWAVEWEEPR